MGGHGDDEPLPVVSFKVLDEDPQPPSVELKGLELSQARQWGYNVGQTWSLTQGSSSQQDGKDAVKDRLRRWLQPIESDLAKQVEYDMDDQDKAWLDAVNEARRAEGNAAVSYELFEVVMDKLEKEWFDLTKRIPRPAALAPLEDSTCAICDDGECENSNAIVFCDGCNLAVHQDCYGVPYIPDGQWLCRKCTVSPDKPVSCVLCPNSYGAFKQTTTSQWAHLLCAIWIPDTGVSNTVYMEPIDGVENISKSRWKLLCHVCKKREGACIQCANKSCFLAFHVTCAREKNFDLKMKAGEGSGELRAYCERHSESYTGTPTGSIAPSSSKKRSHKRAAPAPPLPVASTSAARVIADGLKLTFSGTAPKTTTTGKSARAYKKKFSSGPPVIPHKVYQSVMDYTSKVKIARKPAFVSLVCRYWSLKREARRGAPLLKRLHLEPWTASASSRQHTENQRALKLQYMKLLRRDLENARMLAEQVKKREKLKASKLAVIADMVQKVFFAKEGAMKEALLKIAELDKNKMFAYPVNKHEVPDYHQVIHYPMDWQTIAQKITKHEYLTVADFEGDVDLVLNNAKTYNMKDSLHFKQAQKLEEQVEPIIAALKHFDKPDGDEVKVMVQAAEMLDGDLLSQMFDYHYDYVPPSPKKTVLRIPASTKKRTATEAGLDSPAVKRTTRGNTTGDFEFVQLPADGKPPFGIASVADDGAPTASSQRKERKRERERERKRDRKNKKKGGARKDDAAAAAPAEDDAPQEDEAMDEDDEAVGAVEEMEVDDAPVAGPSRSPSRPPNSRSSHPRRAATQGVSYTLPGQLAIDENSNILEDSLAAPKGEPSAAAALPSKPKSSNNKRRQSEVIKPVAPHVAPAGRKSMSAISGLQKLPPAKVDDVSNSDSFRNFNTGWILPGRTRHKTEDPATVNVGVSERVIKPLKGAAKEGTAKQVKPLATTDEAAAGPPKSSRKGKEKEVGAVDASPAKSAAQQSPADRRKSTGQSKLDAAAFEETAMAATARAEEKSKEKSKKRDKEKEAAPKADPSAPGSVLSKADIFKRLEELRPQVIFPDDMQDIDGILAWGPFKGFPDFPCEICDPDLDDTPADLVALKPKNSLEGGWLLVKWFDPERNSSWIPRRKARMLGENKEVDDLLLSRQCIAAQVPSKNANRLTEMVKKAYDDANALREIDDPAPVGDAGGDEPKSSAKKKGKGKKRA